MLCLDNYLKAGTPIIYLKSSDYSYAIKYVRDSIEKSAYTMQNGKTVTKNLKVWSVSDGLTTTTVGNLLIQPSNPMQPLIEMEKELSSSDSPMVYVLFDYHKFISQPHIWRALIIMVDKLAKTNSNIVIISQTVTVPPEIENYVTVLDYPLPDRASLYKLLNKTLDENGIPKDNLDMNAIVNFGLGLTRTAFLNALFLLIASAPVTTQNACLMLKNQKENILAQTDLLKVLPSDRNFSSLAGLDVMKNFTKRMIAGGLGRGILILGVPGGGKTAFCSCLGNETGRPVLQMDFSRLMGGIVGETESKTAQALAMVDAMQPAILFIDEIEKGLAGTAGGNGDSGVSKRQGGQFLKWLSDHTSDVYVVATANDISALPSEFLRAERWDTIFFVDLPDEEQTIALFDIYRKQYQLMDDNSCDISDIKNWTGAEIKSMCRIARGTGVSLKEASTMVVPMCRVANEKLNNLRKTASQFAISANVTRYTSPSQGFVGVKRIS